MTLQTVAADFARVTHPPMVRQASGWIACHDTAHSRLVTVSDNGLETFQALRAAGFLSPESGSFLSRLATSDLSAHRRGSAAAHGAARR
ncbi:hypothetical protein HV824_26740 [Myxococcus sp. AM009]|uniref:hypothetical protein n=1 Tax=Myxococcus sp. AM009 TaxID=2745137 RepID=UPI0015950769|nr:hypothetical protein [Myxococcus sp. AM009]NVJ01694.1 hypothetical protein [Myxococcus sp. AM009]